MYWNAPGFSALDSKIHKIFADGKKTLFNIVRLYSAEEKCFPFDQRVSGGFGPGEGAACVILKPWRDAVRDGDNIRAIIRNTGTNQDDQTVGISMPSSEAQAALIRSLYKNAYLDLTDVSYVEAHGIGTTVGDPIEAAAFAATFAAKAGPEASVYMDLLGRILAILRL
jgi:acyl transferase domain-containing protein